MIMEKPMDPKCPPSSCNRAALALLALLSAAPALAQSDLGAGAVFSEGRSFAQRDGKALYEAICQGCHMPDAKGAIGAGRYPALAGNPNLAVALYPTTVVLQGLRAMPAFGDQLDDEQIAAAVDYVRSHFGNDYPDAVSPATVQSLRPK